MVIYASFYKLAREPFSLSPDPSFIYPSPTHREAMAQMAYAVRARKGVAVLTGEVGTGKTTLLRHLLETVGSEVRNAYILNPPRSRDELYAALASEFEIDLGSRESRNLVLHRFLINAFKKGVTMVALFDEAQQLPLEVLEEIRLLSNLETGDAKLLQVILAGQPEFDSILDSNEMRALKQRVSLRHSLAPLTMDETIKYVGTRLKLAGADRLPFDPEACRAIHAYSNGIPRLINLLCDNCLLAGYAADQPIIDGALVKSVAINARLAPEAIESRPRGYGLERSRKIFNLRSRLKRAVVAAAVVISAGILCETYPRQAHEAIHHVESTFVSLISRGRGTFAAFSSATDQKSMGRNLAHKSTAPSRGVIL